MENTKMKSEPLSYIMEYYQSRVDEIQQERDMWFKRLESLRIPQKEIHKQDWELKHRAREIAELKKTLNDSSAALLKERELTFKAKQDVERLRGQSVKDRKEIMELLALTNSVEQDITFFKDCRPG